MENEILDLIIIGGGPTGIKCGISAHKANLKFVILEKGVLVNSLFHFPANMTFFSTSKLLEIGDIPFISHTDKPTRKEALEYYRRIVTSYKLPVKLYEKVLAMEQADNLYVINTTKATYYTKHIILATGFYDIPNLMNVPGEDMAKVKHYYDEAHHYLGQKVLVVGAANSACDVALETWQKGAHVTMAVRGAALYERVKYWILPNIKNRISEGSITAHFNTTVTEIQEDTVSLYNEENGNFTIDNDFVLAMTGYRPDYSLLKILGINIRDDEFQTPVYNEDTLETNQPRIFIAGVINGGLMTNKLFIENTRHHGDVIIDQIS